MNISDLYQLARQEYSAGNKGRGIDILERILQEHPNNPFMIGEMGGVLVDLNRKGVGTALLTLACSMEKQNGVEDWRHWSTLGSTLEGLEQRKLAEEAFQEALRVIQSDPERLPEWESAIYDQWAGTYVNAGQPEKCIALSRKALELNPHNVIAKKHLSLGLLESGQWAEAWPLMEARKQVSDYQRPQYPLKQWHGERCDTLIVHGEQGIGDELMYLSLIGRIRDRARRIILEVTPRLVPLLRRSFGQLGCEVYASMEEVAANGGCDIADTKGQHAAAVGPQYGSAPVVREETGGTGTVDLSHIQIGGVDSSVEFTRKPSIVSNASLPYVLGLGRSQVRSHGYLIPDAARVSHWRERLLAEAKGRPIIGIAWEGGVRKTHKKVRNPPFEMWAQVLDPRFCWVSVQYTHGETIHKTMPGALHFQQAIDDLDEQAALISALDLLVSVPQTAVHIAGALAVPTIAIVSAQPRWDFCSDSDDMPWWHSVEMIRQQGTDWQHVFDRLKAYLERRFPVRKVIVENPDAPSPDFPAALSAAAQ